MLLLVVMAGAHGCKPASPPANPAVAPRPALARAPEPEPTPAPLLPEARAACVAALAQARSKQEANPTHQRITVALQELGMGCAQALGALADAAQQATLTATAEKRSEVLGFAARRALTQPGCSVDAPPARGDGFAKSCSPARALGLNEEVLRKLDVGTVAYLTALRLRLVELEMFNADAERILDNLVLSAALEAEGPR